MLEPEGGDLVRLRQAPTITRRAGCEISYWKAYRAVLRGELPAVRPGRRALLVPRADLLDLARRRCGARRGGGR